MSKPKQLFPCPSWVIGLLLLINFWGTFDQGWGWTFYGSDKANTKYVPLDQINHSNVKDLRLAWRWSSVDNEILKANPELWTNVYKATPLMVNGVLYTSTSLSQIAAIDAATGKAVWTYDPQSYKWGSPPNLGFIHRGVAYWNKGPNQRILIGTGDGNLLSLDAETGKPVVGFGREGRIDLTQGLGRAVKPAVLYGVSSPPMVCRNTVVVGSSIPDRVMATEMPPGHVRGFDATTGQLRWVFRSIPKEGEFGVETWQEESWKKAGNANVWTMMSCDEESGYLYLPLSTPTNDYYGGHRVGDNLFAESLVALNVETGERIWHFQMVHHGIWDYDLPAAPNLVDISVNGKKIKAVAQISKQGFIYVFDRITGEPIWPIEERMVPQSTVPGEKTSPTQPFPTKPLPFDRQGLSLDDLIDFTPELRQEAIGIVNQYEYGPLFTSPTEKGTIFIPGVAGGGSWSGAAFDPETGILYVPSFTLPMVVTLTKSNDSALEHAYTGGFTVLSGPQGLPLTKPPYGRITAIDLNEGNHLWTTPVGHGPVDHPALEHLNLSNLGWPRRSFVLLTESLLFVAQQGMQRGRGLSPNQNAGESETENHEAFLWALDPANGEILAEISLPGNAWGSPMTYMVEDKQFIVIPIGGASYPAELVALSLP